MYIPIARVKIEVGINTDNKIIINVDSVKVVGSVVWTVCVCVVNEVKISIGVVVEVNVSLFVNVIVSVVVFVEDDGEVVAVVGIEIKVVVDVGAPFFYFSFSWILLN